MGAAESLGQVLVPRLAHADSGFRDVQEIWLSGRIGGCPVSDRGFAFLTSLGENKVGNGKYQIFKSSPHFIWAFRSFLVHLQHPPDEILQIRTKSEGGR